jgi:hypothetical protein
MHACVTVSSLHAFNRGNSVNVSLVDRINTLGRINGRPLEAIEHACQTHPTDMRSAKLEKLSSRPLEINHMKETIEARC